MSWIKADGYVIECDHRKSVHFFSSFGYFVSFFVGSFVCLFFVLFYDGLLVVGFLIRLIVIPLSACSFIAPNQNVAVVYALLSEVGGAIVSVSGSREQN